MKSDTYCTFKLSNEKFAINTRKIQEVIKLPAPMRVPLSDKEISGVINIRSEIVVALDLAKKLDIDSIDNDQDLKKMSIIVKNGNEAVSLVIDSVGEVLEIEDGEIEPTPNNIAQNIREFLLGVYTSKNSIISVLDIDRILKHNNEFIEKKKE